MNVHEGINVKSGGFNSVNGFAIKFLEIFNFREIKSYGLINKKFLISTTVIVIIVVCVILFINSNNREVTTSTVNNTTIPDELNQEERPLMGARPLIQRFEVINLSELPINTGQKLSSEQFKDKLVNFREINNKTIIYHFPNYKWNIPDSWYIKDVKNNKYYVPQGYIKILKDTEYEWIPYLGNDVIEFYKYCYL